MEIVIKFDSIWQNSFLDDKAVRRTFIATSIDKAEKKEITKNTILGILSRLIGDQRKLVQARESSNYYFKEMEDYISYAIHKYKFNTDISFIVNKSNKRSPQKTYLGIILPDTKLFFSKDAPQLWSVLYLNIEELLEFIINNELNNTQGDSKPDNLLKQINKIQQFDSMVLLKDEIDSIKKKIEKKKEVFSEKEKKFQDLVLPTLKEEKAIFLSKEKMQKEENRLKEEIENILDDKDRKRVDTKLQQVINILSKQYPEQTYYNNGKIFPMSLYAVSLYIQAEKMLFSGLNIAFCQKKNKIQIPGFSKRGFNGVRDFFNPLTGSKEKTVSTPVNITKASGTLKITLDINRDKAKELKQMIENAGVSSFYLGKKGLAYVTNIDTREVR